MYSSILITLNKQNTQLSLLHFLIYLPCFCDKYQLLVNYIITKYSYNYRQQIAERLIAEVGVFGTECSEIPADINTECSGVPADILRTGNTFTRYSERKDLSI